MVKVTNTIDKDLTLQFKGETFTLGAGVSDKFPADVAGQWITIYGFLSVEGSSDKAVDELVEAVVEEKEEKEEKPKKKTARKTTKKSEETKEDKE